MSLLSLIVHSVSMAGPKRHYGAHDFNLGELRRFRVHIYPTLAAANADVATAEARFIYITATQQAYFGKPGTWVEAGGGAASWRAHVAAVVDLATITSPNAGDAVVVLDGDGAGTPVIYQYDGAAWKSVADDTRITLADGSRAFTGIPSVVDAAIQVPVADEDLTTKKYVDDQIAGAGYATPQDVADAIDAHESAGDPHAQYTTDAEATALAQAEVADHEAALDPHSQYTTHAEASGIADGAVAGHEGDAGAHAALLAAHNADPGAHPGLVGAASSGERVSQAAVVIGAAYGEPVVAKAGAWYYEPRASADERPDAIAIASSTVSLAYEGVSLSFNAGGYVDMGGAADRFEIGDVLRFPDAASNIGPFRVDKKDAALGRLWLHPSPVAETPSSDIEVLLEDGIVVAAGPIPIPNGRTIFDSHGVTGQIVAALAQLTVEAGQDLSGSGGGNIAVLAGTSTGNDGSYEVQSVDPVTRTILLESVERQRHAAVAVQEIDVSEKLVVLDEVPDLSDVLFGDKMYLTGTTDNDGRYTLAKFDGIVVFESEVQAIDVDNGGGAAVVTLDATADLTRYVAGDELVLIGTDDPLNDGTHAIASVNDGTKEVTLTTTLPGVDQGTPGGTGTVQGVARFAYTNEPLPGADQAAPAGNAEIINPTASALPGTEWDDPQTIVSAAPIDDIDVDNGGGQAVVTLDPGTDLSAVLAGDTLIIAGADDSLNDGFHEIASANNGTKEVTLVTTLDGADQVTTGGLADIQGTRLDGTVTIQLATETHGYDTSLTADEPGPDFFADHSDPVGYSKTAETWRIGKQVDRDNFLVALEEVGVYRQSVTGVATADRRPMAVYLLDSSGGAFTFDLHASPAEGDRVLLKDVARAAGTNNITIDGNGADIEGSPTLTIDVDGESVALAYLSGEWRIV